MSLGKCHAAIGQILTARQNTTLESETADKHWKGYVAPSHGYEVALVKLVEGLAIYADTYSATYDSPIGDDAIIGAAWHQLAVETNELLNGELKRLNAGILHKTLNAVCLEAGFNNGLEWRKYSNE